MQSQIAVLNRDYNMTNTDLGVVPAPFKPFIGNPQVSFHLAENRPNQGPFDHWHHSQEGGHGRMGGGRQHQKRDRRRCGPPGIPTGI